MKAELPVRAFESGRLMIEGERGRDYRGDIAIDDVQLVDGSCQGKHFIIIITLGFSINYFDISFDSELNSS